MWRKAKQKGDSSSRSLLVRPCACVRFLPELIPLFHCFYGESHPRIGEQGGQSEGDGEGASEWGTGKEKATPGRGVAAVGGTAAAQRAQARPHETHAVPSCRLLSELYRIHVNVTDPVPLLGAALLIRDLCVIHEYRRRRCTWPSICLPARHAIASRAACSAAMQEPGGRPVVHLWRKESHAFGLGQGPEKRWWRAAA